MLNVIWLVMILVAVLVGGFTGKLDAITNGAFDTAKSAVLEIALPLVGLMAIWLGMMRLAERSGLVQMLARALQPVMRLLFPEVPANHPAQGAMVLNMAANMLGLGNAATPLGLRAMALLQKLNPHPGVATNAMVTFLTVNTASIQLIPTAAISILAVQGGKRSSEIIFPALIASMVALVCGVIAARLLSKTRAYRISSDEARVELAESDEPSAEEVPAFEEPPKLTREGRYGLILFFAAFAAMLFVLVWPELANHLPKWMGWDWRYGNAWPDLSQSTNGWQRLARASSMLAIPFLLSFFPLYAWLRRVKVYEDFCEGAKEAFATAKRIIPFLVAMLVAIRMLREAGIIAHITQGLSGFLGAIHFPPELLPLSLMRSLSGSASQGMFVELAKTHGPDSLIAQTASVIYGSSETTFYVLAVYFGSVGIRKMRHAVFAGIIADIIAVVMAVVVCRWWLS